MKLEAVMLPKSHFKWQEFIFANTNIPKAIPLRDLQLRLLIQRSMIARKKLTRISNCL
jgi:hypothetical protein